MATLYWGQSGGTSTGTWSSSNATNWFSDIGRTTPAGAAPTLADDVVFDGASDNGAPFTVTISTGAVCRDLTIQGLDQGMTLAGSAALSVYGGFNLSSTNLTRTYTGTITFSATSGSHNITSGGVVFASALKFDGVGGEWTLQDNITTTAGTSTIYGSRFNFNNKVFTCLIFNCSSTATRTLDFGTSGKIVVTGSNAVVLSVATVTGLTIIGEPRVELFYAGASGTRTIQGGSTGITTSGTNTFSAYVTAGSDTVAMGGNTSLRTFDLSGFGGTLSIGTRTLYGSFAVSASATLAAGTSPTTFAARTLGNTITCNGKTLDFPITFNGPGGEWQCQDALTQGSTRAFTFTAGTIKLKNEVTSTVGAFATSGTNQKFLQSTLAGSRATLSQASGTVSASYLTIQDINATGGATWNAYLTNNNVDGGNNVGWDFNQLQVGRYIYNRRKNKRILF